MRHPITPWILVLAFASVLALTPAAPAEAGGWSVGGFFSVGGLDLAIWHNPGYYSEGYYYRALEPVSYHGYECSDRCYRRNNYTYHWADCPVIQYHFHRYGFSPLPYLDHAYSSWGYYGPHYPVRHHYYYQPYVYRPLPRPYVYRHHPHGRIDYRYRYDHRRHDHRYDHRYDDRDHRGRGHDSRDDRYRHRDDRKDRDHRVRSDHDDRDDRRDDRRYRGNARRRD